MAITFSKSLSTTNLLNAYNNNVVEFSSDNVLDATKCTIVIGSNEFEITPINNVFRYNLKEVIKVLINANEFNDDILPSITASDATSHIYNDTSASYLSQLVDYTIEFTDTSTENISETYKFFKSVEQLEQNKKGVVTSGNPIYVLSPFKKATNNTYNITYFEGYPFDISIYLENTGTTTILNQTNSLSYDFTLPNTVNRLFFSDGRTTITIDDYLPLITGLNELKITNGTDVIYVNVTKIESKQGNYIKWINQYGGWSYWLFNCIHQRKRTIKNGDSVFNDFDNVSETTTPFKNIGVTSSEVLTLVSENVSEYNQEVLNGLLDSPRVYYYTGERLTQMNNVSWLGVKVKNATKIITDYKNKTLKYKLSIELPERYTMNL